MSKFLSVSIVLYKNNKEQIKKAINSAISSKLVDMVYLIDNSPTNQLQSLAFNERIVYIFNDGNIGFGAAHNIAITKAISLGSKYHLVLNPDIYFETGTIESIVQYMDQNSDIGLLMPKILYPNGKIQYLPKLLPSPWSIIKRKLPVPNVIKDKLIEKYELRFVDENRIIEVPIISGCFSFFRTSIFGKVGLYDDRYFMYFEDFDISRRVHMQMKTIYYPVAFVFHGYERGAQKNWRLLKIFTASFLKYFSKWGWFFDTERSAINSATLFRIKNNS